jgi:hypothetical protein
LTEDEMTTANDEQAKPPALPAQDDTEIQRAMRLGQWLAASEMPDGEKGPREHGMAAALRIWYATELGLPQRAASELSVIKGRLVVSVQLMRALARQAGYEIKRLELDDQHCMAAVYDRHGKEIGRSTFTIEDAKRAGLVRDRSGWQTYPQRMLWARAAGWAMRDAIPDVVLGLVLQEEANEIAGEVLEGEAFEVDEDLTAEQEAQQTVEMKP